MADADPLPLLANVISPLMFGVGVQLLFGNIVIGLVEAAVIQRVYGVRRPRLGILAVGANYLSMIVGLFLIHPIGGLLEGPVLGDEPLYRVTRMAAVVVVICFLLSVLVEWPVYHFAFPGPDAGRRRAWRSLYATATAQAASYAMLVPFYVWISVNTLGDWKPTPPRDLAADPGATVLFLSPDGRTVSRMRLDGTGRQKVLDLDSPPARFLRLKALPDGTGLSLVAVDGYNGEGPSRTFRERELGTLRTSPASTQPYQPRRFDNDPWTIPEPVDLRADGAGPEPGMPSALERWAVSTPLIPSRGLRAERRSTGEVRQVAVDFPGLSWMASDATVLPGDQVVFRLGDQIVSADLNTRRIALLALGHGPVVLLEDPILLRP